MRCIRSLAALTPPLALLAAFVGATPRGTSAQAGAQERTLYVSAVDKSGAPIEGLGPDAFIVKENGIRREVLHVSRAVEPIDISLLIDNSAAATDDILYFRKAIPAFIQALSPANPIALIGLADRPTVLTSSTTDTKKLTKQAEGLFARPQTGATFLDAIYEVSKGLQSRDSARAAIVGIITDGTEFTNRYSKDVVAEALQAQTSVQLVTIGRFEHNDDDQAIRERSFLLTDAPKATGGRIYTMLTANGLAQNLEKLAKDLQSQYKVVYGRPAEIIPANSLEVTSSREDVSVRATPARTPKKKGA
jgi:VWFA-related protein